MLPKPAGAPDPVPEPFLMTLFSIATAISGLLFLTILFCSSVAFGCECLYWLRLGVWPHWSITHVTGPIPLTGLIGLDRIIDKCLAYPLSGQIALLGLIAFALVVFFAVLESLQHL
jgi:hypothetical protein